VNRNRLILVGAAVGVAGLLALVLVLLAGSKKTAAPTTTATQTTAAPSRSLAGIPQHGSTIGKAGAPATLVVYEDPQCPYCRNWNASTLPTVVDQYVRTGKLKLEYRGVVIIGQDSVRGLRAIYAAGAQNRLWSFADALYSHQGAENSGWITDAVILAAAREAGAGGQAILAAMGSAKVSAALTIAQKQARAGNLRGTPTFVVVRPPALAQQLTVPGLDPASFMPSLSAALQ
jgi:protein-disulfide isomerase